MKKLILFLFVFPILSFSQDYELTFSDLIKSDDKFSSDLIIGKIKENLYTLGTENRSKSKYIIKKYDSDFKLLFEKEFTLPKEDTYIKMSIIKNGKILLILEGSGGEKNRKYLYGGTLSTEGEIELPLVEISVGEFDKQRNSNTFMVSENTDSTGFLATNIPHSKIEDDKSITFTTFDHQFKNLNEVKLEFPYERHKFRLLNAVASPEGNIHLITRLKLSGDGSKGEHVLKIFTYFKESEKLNEHKINIDENYITEFDLKYRRNGNIILSGFYSDKKSVRMKGIFYVEVDNKDGSIIHTKTTDFTTELLKQFISDRRAEKGRELYHLKVREIYLKENGGLMLLAEDFHYYARTISGAGIGGSNTTQYFDYGNLLVADMDRAGNINWWSSVPKLQNSTNDQGRYGGVDHIYHDNTLHLIYNDHEKNINEVNPSTIRNLTPRSAWVVLVSVSENGEIKKTPLFNTKEKEVNLIPQRGGRAIDNEIILVAVSRKYFRLCNLKFK